MGGGKDGRKMDNNKKSVWMIVFDAIEKLVEIVIDLAKVAIVLLLIFALFLGLSTLHKSFSPEEKAKSEQEQAETLREEYERGYEQGAKDQRERDFETFTLSGRSVRDIINKVSVFYGMTPVEAFRTVDEYECDSTHGGITWEEYQTAIRVCINTAGMMDDE